MVHCKRVHFAEPAMKALCSKCVAVNHLQLQPDSDEISLLPALNQIGQYCDSLEMLSVRASGRISGPALTSVMRRCTKLRTVDLGSISLTAAAFLEMARNCQALNRINICLNGDDQRFAEGLKLLGKTLTSFSGGMHESILFLTACHWEKLTALSLFKCKWSDLLLEHVATYCTGVISLGIYSGAEDISEVGLAAMAARMPQLQKFGLASRTVNNAGVMAVATGCPSLTKMTIRLSTNVTDASARAMLAQVHIKEIYFHHCQLVSEEVNDMCNKWSYSNNPNTMNM